MHRRLLEHSQEVAGRSFTTFVPGEQDSRTGKVRIEPDVLERVELWIAAQLARSGSHSPEAFRFMRKALNMPANQLAELLDVTPETISRWERGKRPVEKRALFVLGRLVLDARRDDTESLEHLASIRTPTSRICPEVRTEARWLSSDDGTETCTADAFDSSGRMLLRLHIHVEDLEQQQPSWRTLVERHAHRCTLALGERLTRRPTRNSAPGDTHRPVDKLLALHVESKNTPDFELRFISGPRMGHFHTLSPNEILTLGQDSNNTIMLRDLVAGEHHAQISWNDGAYGVQDCDSPLGTYVNGECIAERTRLEPGDSILMGTSVLKLVKLGDST